MTATNYRVFRPKDVDGVKFGSTAWTTANIAAATVALHTAYAANNATDLLNIVGDRDANDPVKSEAFAKDITYSGNERTTTEENLLGADTNGTQNQEVSIGPTSLQQVELTLVYRNNVPFSIFNDTTKCCLMTMDNEEGTTSGQVNMAFNNITILHVGSITMSPDGLMEQKMKFSHKGGTTGTAITGTDTGTWTTMSRIVGGDYSEEVRLS